ncbi:hypothetical protein, variant 1 [Aphanomyces astaci]|uniref:Uncharacterized protein n=2 Tax=Aphanomyces astaci TaxID=112090 RepID=W4FJW2_APHAT|nr:hypothetical protein, variant 1 [Aphanomyces astaci]ETV67104.1 hypothetical protein, variant 1 [Aphanomyces astaci]|eukprot:XP_009843474.1 hypothetical protein, variant 1 [Aphanomyces astaci]
MSVEDPWHGAIWDAASAIFQELNPENPSMVDLTELETLCMRMGVRLAAHDLTQGMYDLDTTGAMVIPLDVFCLWWLRRLRSEEAAAAALAIEAAAATGPPATHVWETVVDGAARYYYDHVSGETKWDLHEFVAAARSYFASLKDESTDDRALLTLFAKHDLSSRGKLDADEWRGLLLGLGLPGTLLSMADVAGQANDVTYEHLHRWWHANVPQKSRERMADWTEWWRLVDETHIVTFWNERTTVRQWYPPSIPTALVTLLQAEGFVQTPTSLDEAFAQWFQALDVDGDGALNATEFTSMLALLGHTNVADKDVRVAMTDCTFKYWGDITPSVESLVGYDAIVMWWRQCYAKGVLGDWEEVATIDEVDGRARMYYYNWKTQVTQWEPPVVTGQLQTLLDQFSADPTVSTNERIRRLFVQYDTDETGALDASELERICAALGHRLDGPALDSMMRVLDTSGDGVVSLEEFQAWWHSKLHVDHQFQVAVEQRSRADDIRAIVATYLKRSIHDSTPFESNVVPRLVQLLGRTCRGAPLLRALHEMDADGTRLIDVSTFISWYLKYDKACGEAETKAREAQHAQEAMDVWVETVQDNGTRVYVNSRTNETMWEKPGIQQHMDAMGKDLKAIFRQFDKDGSGSIDAVELQALLGKLGQPVDGDQMQHVMKAMDTSGDGVVTLDELTTWWVCMQRRVIGTANAAVLKDQVMDYHQMSKDAVKALRGLFHQFDTDHSGSIDTHELKHLLHRLGYNPSEAERKKLLDAIDTSGDGSINVDEFIAWWVTVHRTREIQSKAAQDGHLLASIQAASAAAAESATSASKAAATRFDLPDLSVTNFRNKLVDLRYNWSKGPPLELPVPEPDAPVDFGGPRLFGTADISHTHPSIVAVMRLLIDDVVLITPLLLPDAAQRIQKMYRSKLARKKLIQTLNDRFVHHHDPTTGASYYMNRLTKEIRFTKPLLLGHHEIQSPRSRLREKHVHQAMTFRRKWMVSIMQANALSTTNQQQHLHHLSSSPTFRTAAFYVYQVLCNIKARWKLGVWPALAAKEYTLAQLVVRHYPRQLKKPGPWGDLPLHFAMRHRLSMAVITTFLKGNVDVVTMTNASGHTPLHLACRDYPSMEVVSILLGAPHGTLACSRGCPGTLQTPLHVGIRHHAPLAVLALLLDADESVLFQRNQARNTPFHEALTANSRSDQLDILKLCVLYDTSPSNSSSLAAMPAFESAWPLHIALQHNPSDLIVRYVLDLAPQALVVPFRQLLPLFLTMKHRRSEALIMHFAQQTVVAIHPPMTICTSKQFNPVHYALLYGFSPGLVLFLLTLCPEWASQANHMGDFPLHIAVASTSPSDLNVLKKLLLLDPAPARLPNVAGRLPLHLAVERGDVDAVKKLLQVCPWSLLDKITGTPYDALLLTAKATTTTSNNESIVDALLVPPKLAPKRPKGTVLGLSPYYVAATSRSSSSVSCFDKLHVLDTCTSDDLYEMARKKMRQAFHKPTDQWDLPKILRLMALNPLDAAIQTRSLLAINGIVRSFDESSRETCLETLDIVRTLQHTMYDFTTNPRIQLLGQKCLNHLLPTAFAKAKYQSRIDPLYKF